METEQVLKTELTNLVEGRLWRYELELVGETYPRYIENRTTESYLVGQQARTVESAREIIKSAGRLVLGQNFTGMLNQNVIFINETVDEEGVSHKYFGEVEFKIRPLDRTRRDYSASFTRIGLNKPPKNNGAEPSQERIRTRASIRDLFDAAEEWQTSREPDAYELWKEERVEDFEAVF